LGLLLLEGPARLRRALAQLYPVPSSVNRSVGVGAAVLKLCVARLDGCFRLRDGPFAR
jgi:hypothetical protein